ncbi:TPA: hypothetical protein JAN03_14940 [Citrobacter freundii]|nr:hypothetical protein [Citrobacter freundii]
MVKLNLSTTQILDIRKIITHWEGKLTWLILTSKIESELNIKISRQSLCKYQGINSDFKKKKESLRGFHPEINAEKQNVSTLLILQERIRKLETELELYKMDYNKAQQVLQTIIVNAKRIPGVDINLLFTPVDE